MGASSASAALVVTAIKIAVAFFPSGTSAIKTADFLAETHPRCTAFVLGEAGLNLALQKARIPNDGIHPHYVVVGEGSPAAEKWHGRTS